MGKMDVGPSSGFALLRPLSSCSPLVPMLETLSLSVTTLIKLQIKRLQNVQIVLVTFQSTHNLFFSAYIEFQCARIV